MMPSTDAAKLAELGKILTQVGTIQLLGYLLKRSGAISAVTEAGMGHYVGMLGFPAVLFSALANLEMPDGIMPLLLAILASKAIVFALAFALGLLSTPHHAPDRGLTRGAMLAIFGTQSDDVALGVPVLSVIFPSCSATSLYVLSAMQAIVFNPIAYIIFGIGGAHAKAAAVAARDDDDDDSSGGGGGGGADDASPPNAPASPSTTAVRVAPRARGSRAPPSLLATVGAVLLGLRSNMLVLATVAGITYRLVSFGTPLPWVVSYPLELLGRPFEPLVYLIGGFGGVGAFQGLTQLRSAALPLGVVCLKSLCLPIIALGAIHWFGHTPSSEQVNFLFVYALLPTANSALVIARLHGAAGSLLASLSSALALNKIAGFALLYFAAVLSTACNSTALLQMKSDFSYVMVSGSVVGGLWLGLSTLLTPVWYRCHGMRILLTHFGLQFVYAFAFLVLQSLHRYVQNAAHPLMRPGDDPHFAQQYALVNTLRWAANGSLAIIALDWARCVRAAAAMPRNGTKPPPQGMGVPSHLLGASVIGLAHSLPFTLGAAGAPKPRALDLGTDFWLGYGDPQALTYCVSYSVLALGMLGCVVVVGLTKRTARARHSARTGAGETPPMVHDDDSYASEPSSVSRGDDWSVRQHPVFLVDSEHCTSTCDELPPADALVADPYPYSLRLGVLLVAGVVKCAGQAGMCAQFYSESPQDASHLVASSSLEMMMLFVALEDGQGVLSSLLFGLQSANVAVLRRCLDRLGKMPIPGEVQRLARPSEVVALAADARYVLTAYVTRPSATSNDDHA